MNSCNLEDFSEGLIGKLIVRKSGKVQMMLGQTLLDVEMGTPCGFLQVNNTKIKISMISAPDAGNMVMMPNSVCWLRPEGDWIPFQGKQLSIFSFVLTTGDHF